MPGRRGRASRIWSCPCSARWRPSGPRSTGNPRQRGRASPRRSVLPEPVPPEREGGPAPRRGPGRTAGRVRRCSARWRAGPLPRRGRAGVPSRAGARPRSHRAAAGTERAKAGGSQDWTRAGPRRSKISAGGLGRFGGARRPERAPAGPRRNSVLVPALRSARGPGSRSRSPIPASPAQVRANSRPARGRPPPSRSRPADTNTRGDDRSRAGSASGQTRQAGVRLRGGTTTCENCAALLQNDGGKARKRKDLEERTGFREIGDELAEIGLERGAQVEGAGLDQRVDGLLQLRSVQRL